jgi:NTP pyrophosphatase (non-canonical NTP hydrolase)
MSGPYSITTDIWPGLAKVMEEAGELLQILGKIMSVDGSLNYYDGTDLAERIEEEAADLYAALDFFCEVNNLYARESGRRDRKRARLRNWHVGTGSSGSSV